MTAIERTAYPRFKRSLTTKDLAEVDRKSTRLNSSHLVISYAVFCLKKKKKNEHVITGEAPIKWATCDKALRQALTLCARDSAGWTAFRRSQPADYCHYLESEAVE